MDSFSTCQYSETWSDLGPIFKAMTVDLTNEEIYNMRRKRESGPTVWGLMLTMGKAELPPTRIRKTTRQAGFKERSNHSFQDVRWTSK